MNELLHGKTIEEWLAIAEKCAERVIRGVRNRRGLQDAEDYAQEVVTLKFLPLSQEGKVRSNPEALLRKMVKNRIMDDLRKPGLNTIIDWIDQVVDHRPPPLLTPEAALEDDPKFRLLVTVSPRLRPLHSVIVHCVVFGDLDLDEARDKYRLRRALCITDDHLRKCKQHITEAADRPATRDSRIQLFVGLGLVTTDWESSSRWCEQQPPELVGTELPDPREFVPTWKEIEPLEGDQPSPVYARIVPQPHVDGVDDDNESAWILVRHFWRAKVFHHEANLAEFALDSGLLDPDTRDRALLWGAASYVNAINIVDCLGIRRVTALLTRRFARFLVCRMEHYQEASRLMSRACGALESVGEHGVLEEFLAELHDIRHRMSNPPQT